MKSVQDIRDYLDKLEKDVATLEKITNYDDLAPVEVACIREAQQIQIICNRIQKELNLKTKDIRRNIVVQSRPTDFVKQILEKKETNGSGDNRSETEEVAKPVKSKRKTTKKA